MIHVMVVTPDPQTNTLLRNAMAGLENLETEWVTSETEALARLKGKRNHLVISDETLAEMTGIEFLNQLVRVNPFINTVLLSSLSPHDFHEATEGLGILGQLPLKPEPSHLKDLLSSLSSILRLSAPEADKK